MILSKDEAICLILGISKNKEVSSPTKLNKLLARLNLYFIPIEINFSLNKFGSFSADLSSLQANDYYDVAPYSYMGRIVNKFVLKSKGQELFTETIKLKINKILTDEEFNSLKETIQYLNSLSVTEISDNEHKKLLVDIDDRFKLQQKINENFIELFDLYQQIGKLPENKIAEIRLKALIEYCYQLIKYLKEKRFELLSEEEYDFNAHMFDYYFLDNISQIIPFLNKQISEKEKNGVSINKFYQYFVNSVKEGYPFSINNKDLKELIV